MESNLNMKTIKVSDKGQIAIPQAIREKAGIDRGDELVIIQTRGKILLEKAQKISNQMKEDFKDIIRFSEDSLKEVWDNKEDDIWSTYLKN
jgi:AbrB family looped-hinge helix DNA binding protein